MATVEVVLPIGLRLPRDETQSRPSILTRLKETVQDRASERRTTREARQRTQEVMSRHHQSLVPEGASAMVRKKAELLLTASRAMDTLTRNRLAKRVAIQTLYASSVDVERRAKKRLTDTEDGVEMHGDYVVGRPRREQIDVLVSVLSPVLLLARREILDRERARLRPPNPNPRVQSFAIFDARAVGPPMAAA